MKIEEIKKLAQLMDEFGLDSISVEEDDSKVKLTRPSSAPVVVAAPAPVAATAPVAPAQPAAEPPPEGRTVTSPIVGVFYSASAPGADPFVAVGQTVTPGDVLCIVEAMKMMNEITADFGGEVVAVLAKDGDIVECGQPLFRLK